MRHAIKQQNKKELIKLQISIALNTYYQQENNAGLVFVKWLNNKDGKSKDAN